MEFPHERLRAARRARYGSAAKAAAAMGVKPGTYTHHENGIRGFDNDAARYARFFGVSLDWLLGGRGEMRPKGGPRWSIPVVGYVGTGATVDLPEQAPKPLPSEQLHLEPEHLGILIVEGDSQYPRFLPGEAVLFDTRNVPPATLFDQYAIVQDHDGRRLLKILQRGSREGLYDLASHNRATERDVPLIAAWKYLGVLSGK